MVLLIIFRNSFFRRFLFVIIEPMCPCCHDDRLGVFLINSIGRQNLLQFIRGEIVQIIACFDFRFTKSNEQFMAEDQIDPVDIEKYLKAI